MSEKVKFKIERERERRKRDKRRGDIDKSKCRRCKREW
jgi:hypothetical protein